MRPKCSSLIFSKIVLSLSALCAVLPARGYPQSLSIGELENASVKSCDDYATQILNNPWDMSDRADVNNYFKDFEMRALTNLSIGSNGLFEAKSTVGESMFYLWSPMICATYPVGGRWGAPPSLGIDSAINFTAELAQKYSLFSIRLYHSAITQSPAPILRLRWDRDCSFDKDITLTNGEGVREGWHTYTYNLKKLTTVGIPAPWTDGSITGFSILPTNQPDSQIKVDWIRLEDPDSCKGLTTSSSYSTSAPGENVRVAFALDDNADPFDGVLKKVALSTSALSNSTVSITESTALPPGDYHLVGVLDSDYATLEGFDPWDMENKEDITQTSDLLNGTFDAGAFSGRTTTDSSNVYLNLPVASIDASIYKNFSIHITRSDISQPIRIIWNGGSVDLDQSKNVGNNVYQLDLSTNSAWTGKITFLVIRPSLAPEIDFSIDFASLRAQGFDTSRSKAALISSESPNRFHINAPPVGSFEKPSLKGGQAYEAWNMNSGDMQLLDNLRNDADPTQVSEPYSGYLNDSRLVAGVRGDIFKGTNIAGNGDPVNFSIFPLGKNFSKIDAARFKNICFRMFIDHDFSLLLGSSARVLWQQLETGQFTSSEDIVTITDRWTGSPWYEYCVDLTKIFAEETTTPNWLGTISALRVDPNEFAFDKLDDYIQPLPDSKPISISYYLDYIKLRTNDRANQKFTLAYSLKDSDTSSPNLQFLYSPSSQFTDATVIPASDLSCEGKVCIWNTSKIPTGSYTLFAKIEDPFNSGTFRSSGVVDIDHSFKAPTAVPILKIESPTSGALACDSLQVKGYSLQKDRLENVAAVQFFIDGTAVGNTQPNLFSPQAKIAFPKVDSSDSGFDQFIDISTLAMGDHQLSVKSYSSQGVSASVGPISFTRTSSQAACPTPLSDPDPKGLTYAVEVGKEPIIKSAKLSKQGLFSLSLSQFGSGQLTCVENLLLGSNKSRIDTFATSLPIKANDFKRNTIVVRARGLRINKSRFPKLYIQIERVCEGVASRKSRVVKISPKTKGSISTLTALAKYLAAHITRS